MEKSNPRMLFDVLDKIGASEKVRQLYKETARYYEMLRDISVNHAMGVTYVFGSMSEGTTTPGLNADFDLVTCSDIPVVLNLEDARYLKCGALSTQNEKTPPGYVKLQFIYHGLEHIRQIFEKLEWIRRDDQGVYYFANILHIYKLDTCLRQEIHGPATTVTHATAEPMDNLICFRCKHWPSFAKEWLVRVRRHGWPNKHIIDQCENLGFFLVRIGHPYSKEKDFEWRVSFSLQERVLMFNLTEVQYKTYVLLKLIKHDLIERNIGKSITSYHCKSSILYVIEQNPQSIWYPENLFACAIKCLKVLLVWAREGHCPNYFIPDENMFDGKVTEKIRNKIIDVLEHILNDGEHFLDKIETDNFGKYFMHRDEKDVIEYFEKTSFQTSSLRIFQIHTKKVDSVLCCVAELLNGKISPGHGNQPTIGFKSLEECLRVIEDNVANRLCSKISQGQGNKLPMGNKYQKELLCAIDDHQKLLNWLKSIGNIAENTIDETRDVIDPILPFIHSSLACHLLSYGLQSEDIPTRNEYLGLSEEEFQKGMTSDVASGRLKNITCLYKLGKYESCQKELILLEQQFNSSVHSVSPFRSSRNEFNHGLLIELRKHSCTTKYLLQHFISAYVIFLPTELEIVPNALQFEMIRSAGTLPETRILRIDYWYDWVVVESEVYMYFLWYLLSRAMKASPEERLFRWKQLYRSVRKGRLHEETAYNIYAWVCSLENFIPEAIKVLAISWNTLRLEDELKDYKSFYKEHWQLPYNAAKLHMLIILQQVWFSKKSFRNVCFLSFCFKCFHQFRCELKKCSSCKIAKYCSVNCQKMDWKIHKTICMQIRNKSIR